MHGISCELCHCEYDTTQRSPRHLRCGHGACDECVGKLRILKTIECPTCRRISKLVVDGDVPINYQALNILREDNKFRRDANIRTDSGDDVKNMKIKHVTERKTVMLNVENNINSLSTKISDLKLMKLKIKEKQRKLSQEEEKLSNCLKNYDRHFKTICDARDKSAILLTKLEQTTSIGEIHDTLQDSFKWQQFVKLWCSVNMGPNDVTAITILADGRSIMDMLLEGQLVSAIFSIKDEEYTATLSFKNDMIHMHTMSNQTSPFGAVVLPYEQLISQSIEPPSLVFMELSYKGVAQGSVYIRLLKDLPQCALNMRLLCTGEQGTNLKNLRFNFGNDDWLRGSLLSSMHIPKVTRDNDAHTHEAVEGDVVGAWMLGQPLSMLYFQHGPLFSYPTAIVFGKIKSGLDVIKKCSEMNIIEDLHVSDCGIVLEDIH